MLAFVRITALSLSRAPYREQFHARTIRPFNPVHLRKPVRRYVHRFSGIVKQQDKQVVNNISDVV